MQETSQKRKGLTQIGRLEIGLELFDGAAKVFRPKLISLLMHLRTPYPRTGFGEGETTYVYPRPPITPRPPALETAAASWGPAATFIPLLLAFGASLPIVELTQGGWGVECRLWLDSSLHDRSECSQSSVMGVLITDMVFECVLYALQIGRYTGDVRVRDRSNI